MENDWTFSLDNVDDWAEPLRLEAAITSMLETGHWSRDYGCVSLMEGDTGGLSVGWLQMALQTNTQELIKACQTYIAHDGIRAAQLSKIMPQLQAYDKAVQASDETEDLFVAMAKERLWREIQDGIYKHFRDQAMVQLTDALEGTSLTSETVHDLTRAVAANGVNQGHFARVAGYAAEAREGKGSYASVLQDDPNGYLQKDPETAFLWSYLQVRKAWLGKLSPAAQKSTYRIEVWMWLLEQGDWDFHYGMEVYWPLSTYGNTGSHVRTLTASFIAVDPPTE